MYLNEVQQSKCIPVNESRMEGHPLNPAHFKPMTTEQWTIQHCSQQWDAFMYISLALIHLLHVRMYIKCLTV